MFHCFYEWQGYCYKAVFKWKRFYDFWVLNVDRKTCVANLKILINKSKHSCIQKVISLHCNRRRCWFCCPNTHQIFWAVNIDVDLYVTWFCKINWTIAFNIWEISVLKVWCLRTSQSLKQLPNQYALTKLLFINIYVSNSALISGQCNKGVGGMRYEKTHEYSVRVAISPRII